jgi:hypothetical protein
MAMNNSPKPRLKVGEASASGQIVASILGQSSKVTVFTTQDKHLRWQYHENNGDIPEAQLPILNEFDSLMSDVRVFVPQHNQLEAYTRLGKALFFALNSKETPDQIKSFDAVKSFITQSSTQRARFIYTAFALGAALLAIIVLLLVSCFLFSQFSLYFYGAIFGATGAAVSVMQRSKDIELDVRLPDPAIYLQACIRVLLGLVFGFLFMLASKANLVMGIINNDIFALCLFAVVAGFSERFIPDLIERLEIQAKSDINQTHRTAQKATS